MELNDGFGAISAFHCHFFASTVLFNLLLESEKKKKKRLNENPHEIAYICHLSCIKITLVKTKLG